ncbi:hypothetical protein SPV1_04348 [Mariprofundus ferrooxydans PV-1]|uniref:Uncharacterized protein n=1 Tax=Mariprofundus ferrooxydans PV-1 TaxID=314345 RepID=Q0F3C1_9PROT|nr:hypothetical protein SPV1_04348 [Mariprofundus ferrooxydans PV-1]
MKSPDVLHANVVMHMSIYVPQITF